MTANTSAKLRNAQLWARTGLPLNNLQTANSLFAGFNDKNRLKMLSLVTGRPEPLKTSCDLTRDEVEWLNKQGFLPDGTPNPQFQDFINRLATHYHIARKPKKEKITS